MDMNTVTDFRGQLARFRKANQVTIVVTAEDGLTTLPLTLRKIGLEDLVFSGQIPDSLSGLVDGMLTGKQQTGVQAQNLGQLGQLFDHVMLVCVVEPPLAEEGDELHLGVDEIPFAVKEATFQWVNGEALALEPFRPQPGRNGPSALPGEDLRPTTEQPGQPTEQLGSLPV